MALKSKFTLSTQERYSRRFSEDIKRRKVKEIEQGKTTIAEVCKVYEVSYSAVYKWLDKYGLHKKTGQRLILEDMSDTKKIIALKKKIAELEQLVGQKQIIIDFQEKMIELAEEQYGITLKKNSSTKRSYSSGRKGNKTDLA